MRQDRIVFRQLKELLQRKGPKRILRRKSEFKANGARRNEPPRDLRELSFESAEQNLRAVRLVSIGSEVGDEVVINVPQHGHYRARLFENFFCVGSRGARTGRLMRSEGLYFLCPHDCTRNEAEKFIGSVVRKHGQF